jgi:hypothetical protein
LDGTRRVQHGRLKKALPELRTQTALTEQDSNSAAQSSDAPHLVTVLLEEYKTLRDESLHSLRQQQQVLQIGFGAIGIVAGLGLN